MREFVELVQEIFTLFGQYMSIPAVIAGAGAIVIVRYLVPSSDSSDKLSVIPGVFITRLLPLLGPLMAILICVAMEWDKKFTVMDFARGINSGIGSEFIFQLYRKTFSGK